jgi:nucleoid-associated protein Lsr2
MRVASAVVEVEMATKVTPALEDDLDGGPAVETVRFAVGGAEYEIDLNKKNAAVFRRKLGTVHRTCAQGRAGTAPPGRRSVVGRKRSAAIRAWASEQGIGPGPSKRARPRVNKPLAEHPGSGSLDVAMYCPRSAKSQKWLLTVGDRP